MKKNISIILFLLLFVFLSSGYFVYFKILQINIKQDIKLNIRNGLKDEDLTLIIIPADNKDDIIWTKKNKEFRFNDNIYDIVRFEVKNNKIFYYCINDIKERQLISSFSNIHQKNNILLRNLKRVIFNKFISNISVFVKNLNKMDISFPIYSDNYKSLIIKILPPPPQV